MLETSYLRSNSTTDVDNNFVPQSELRKNFTQNNNTNIEAVKINNPNNALNNKPGNINTGNKMTDFLLETAELRKKGINNNTVFFNQNNINDANNRANINPLRTLPVNFTHSSYFGSNSGNNNAWFGYSQSNSSISHQRGNSNNFESRVKYLSDLEYKNPDISQINNYNFKVQDEIGKKCLQLTNEFRKRNNLRELK